MRCTRLPWARLHHQTSQPFIVQSSRKRTDSVVNQVKWRIEKCLSTKLLRWCKALDAMAASRECQLAAHVFSHAKASSSRVDKKLQNCWTPRNSGELCLLKEQRNGPLGLYAYSTSLRGTATRVVSMVGGLAGLKFRPIPRDSSVYPLPR